MVWNPVPRLGLISISLRSLSKPAAILTGVVYDIPSTVCCNDGYDFTNNDEKYNLNILYLPEKKPMLENQ